MRIEPAGSELIWEQLWARKVTGNRFEVCCIPFFAYDLALGDIVATGAEPETANIVQRVVEASNRYTFRAWFAGAPDPNAARMQLTALLARRGHLYEFYSAGLMSIDSEPEKMPSVVELLAAREANGMLVYETGRTR